MMTRSQLYKSVSTNKWIAVRWNDGSVFGVNCLIMQKLFKKYESDEAKTNVIGFYPISFAEYIRIKIWYAFPKTHQNGTT